jgi:SAM-dependent methyltransferase
MIGRKELEFSELIDEYVVFKLELSSYQGTRRSLPSEARFAPPEIRDEIREDEKRLLQLYFQVWEKPFEGQLPGWREDSPIYLLWNEKLICGVYLCEKNEFNDENFWGQLHYTFMDPQFRGRGLYSVVFHEAVQRAKIWGLKGLYLNTDRYLLPMMYERWGATFWKRIPKNIANSKRSNIRPHNWLVHRIHDEQLDRLLKQYAKGILADIGCGEKPYSELTRELVISHIGVDHNETFHDHSKIDVFATAYDTTLNDASVDTILCTAVLEHLERPGDAIREMYRILKPGGYVILSAPLFWHLHEEPRDFYRYTKYGLDFLFTNAGFEIKEVIPLSGFIVTFCQELCYFLEHLKQRPFSRLISFIQFNIQWLAYILRKWDKTNDFTWMYLVVGRKPIAN